MESLYQLIQSLTPGEFETIRNSYQNQMNKNPEVLKTLKLLDYLRTSPCVPQKEVCVYKIYRKKTTTSFRMLKSRLKGRILDCLITESNIDKINEVEQLDLMSIRLRKKLVQVTCIYLTKGNLSIVYELLEDIIISAKDYNIYSVIIEALRLKKAFFSLRTSDEDVNAIQVELLYYQKCDQARNKALDYYYNLIRKVDFKANEKRVIIQNLLIDAIHDLKQINQELKVPAVTYYLKLLEMAYYSNEQNYTVAKETCLELIPLLQFKELYKKERVGITHDNLAKLNILLLKYNEALKHVTAAQKYYKKSSINLIISKEQEFYAALYSRDLDYATEISNFLLSHLKKDQGNFRQDKFHYFRACVLFLKEKYFEVYKITRTNLEISEDKGGWDVAIRILSIISNIELKYFDQASSEIISLKRHLERTVKKENIRERDKIILKVLRTIEKNSFSWSSLSIDKIPALQLLISKEPKYAWQPLTAELFPFEDWLLPKLSAAIKEEDTVISEKENS